MSSVIGTLRVNLGLDSVEFQNGLRKANTGMRKFAKAAGVTMALAAATAAAGLVALARQSLGVIDTQTKLARSLQTTTRSVQILSRAGEIAGVSMSGVEQAAKDMHRRLSQASLGAGPAVEALKMLGLNAEALMALPLDQRIAEINAAITKFVPAAGRAAVAAQLFGEEGSIAISRLDPETISKAAKEVDNLGVAVSEMDAKAIERANDALSAIGLAVKGFGNQLAALLAPVIERVARLIVIWAIKLGDLRKAISNFFGRQSELQVATDNLVLALGDEITQSGLLNTALGNSTAMSIDAAKKKLSEAIARNENVKAIIAERRALALGSTEYSGLTERIEELQGALNAQGFPAIDVAVAPRADAFERTQQALADLLVQRDKLLSLPKELKDQLNLTEENIKTLETAIANASGEMVTFGDAATEAIEPGARLSGAINEIGSSAEDASSVMEGQLKGAVESLSKAFADWVVRGFKDFKGFVSAVLNSFKNMIAEMIAYAVKNKILVALGFSGAGTAASAGTSLSSSVGSALLGSFGSAGVAGTGILGGLGGVWSGVSTGFASGGLGGAVSGFFGSTAAGISGGIAAGGVAGIGAAIGAALPIIGIGLALFSLFKSKPIISKKHFRQIKIGLELTGQQLDLTGVAAQKAAAQLKKAAGGMKNFAAQTQFYFDNFFTDSEKRAKALESLTEVFDKIGIQLPTTAQQFRNIVESLDLTTKSGRTAYSEMLKVAPVFTKVFGSITDAGEALNSAFGDDVFTTREQMQATMAALNRGATIGQTQFGSGVVNLGEVITVTERMNQLQSETATASTASAVKLSQILTYFQRWDGDGMPEVRPA